jgi:hypothetical protein
MAMEQKQTKGQEECRPKYLEMSRSGRRSWQKFAAAACERQFLAATEGAIR